MLSRVGVGFTEKNMKMCEYVKVAGEEGRQAFMDGLNKLKTKQVDIITKQTAASTYVGEGRVVSMPAIIIRSKKVDKKIQSRCSPKKRRM